MTANIRMPVAFVSHGAPTLALDQEKGAELRRWSGRMPRPKALLVVSAHWEDTPLALGTSQPRGLLYDFGGFAKALYQLRYDAPGAPGLSARVAELLGAPPLREDRMWDHGVWVPLLHMYSEAELPLLQISLPSRGKTSDLFAIGQLLRPLRDEGVLILASGGMVHNLGRIAWDRDNAPENWAKEFEDWAKRSLVARDVDALIDMESQAPALRSAHPTLEHILPLLVAVGAATDDDAVQFPIEGFEYGNLSRTAVQFG